MSCDRYKMDKLYRSHEQLFEIYNAGTYKIDSEIVKLFQSIAKRWRYMFEAAWDEAIDEDNRRTKGTTNGIA